MASDSKNSLPDYDQSFIGDQQPSAVFACLKRLDWAFTDDQTQFLTHDLHPYPAKFIPQIPGTIISRLSRPGDCVLDPFGGSGTTALEAVRLGRRAISLDANPVATLIGRVKTAKENKVRFAEINGFHARLKEELQSLPKNPKELVNEYSRYIPEIPNREKWFPDSSCGELALIKARIASLDSPEAKEVALLALSRIALRASYQDSETRYKSVPRDIPSRKTLTDYLKELESVREAIARTDASIRYGVTTFFTADVRTIGNDVLPNGVADLIVTSPPYGNANDYHLYHRFRLLWLGFDPKLLASVEIGSHLKHQREGSGFASYLADMESALNTIRRLLRPGRYAALVIGSSIYAGKDYDSAKEIQAVALKNGFDASAVISREIHKTKRSFVPAARRAREESILFIRKEAKPVSLSLYPPPYKLWPYEEVLRARETTQLTRGVSVKGKARAGTIHGVVNCNDYPACRQLVFSHSIQNDGGATEPTWQAILENGAAQNPAARKDPKYVTHGLHPYKGKFYPQLAKGLLNIVDPIPGALTFDPFCGSGTTLLEGYLNGLRPVGMDMNPVAALIARAKVGILDVAPDIVTEACTSVLDMLECSPQRPSGELSEFNVDCLDEIGRWFAAPVAQKINWSLRQIRKLSVGHVRAFLEATLSSIIRDVSQQEPTDLRVRYRKSFLKDADVYGLFKDALKTQLKRLEKFWSVRGYSPHRFYSATVGLGDSRDLSSLKGIGLNEGSVDLVVTSPPYATALPYIDTDRLSLLTIVGLSSTERRPIEYSLIGSREITNKERREILDESTESSPIPEPIRRFVATLADGIATTESGFRKQNMPALLLRFFADMQSVLANTHALLKPGASAMVVIGDNTMEVDDNKIVIPTTDFVAEVARHVGFCEHERIDISVTTENLVHIKNAITKNVVLWLKKPNT